MTTKYITRRYFLKVIAPITVCLAIAGCASIPFLPDGTVKPFSIIVLPDTQFYSESFPDMFFTQTKWIRDHRDDLNVVCVLHEGDLVQNPDKEEEWKIADRAISALDGVVPYFLTAGNHDGTTPDGYPLFNKYFSASRFENEKWYGGHFGKGNENAYYFFKAGGMKFMVVCLEFEPREKVLDWANDLTAGHKDHRTIVLTHCYMNSDNTRIAGNFGERIWNRYARRHDNIFLVLSGHVSGAARLTSRGDNGNRVHQILADYQHLPNGGNAWLRIMNFVPKESKIIVKTYSPALDKYWLDAQNQFEIEYEMR